MNVRPIVVGSGPAGLFASLCLAQAGLCPILLERGLDVDSRRREVALFWRTGVLDQGSNVQFGEGGAGTFSDGKLKIGQRDARKLKVLGEFIEAGAPDEIMTMRHPHIGTDRLGPMVKNIRRKIIRLGGEVRFGATVTDVLHEKGQLTGVRFTEKGTGSELSTNQVVLAIGNSARDTFANLLDCGVSMEQKPIAVGVRIEHTQEMIDVLRHGDTFGPRDARAADYRMVVHLPDGRGVYTFCMCPGGSVVAAASEQGGVVTNGMSLFKRNGPNANSALLVTVSKKDIGSGHPLAGVAFQRQIEAAAYRAGGGGHRAPVQRMEDFLQKRESTAFGDVLPTYTPGTGFARVDDYLPLDIAESLRQGIREMGEWMPGFAWPDALLTGAETRSSSPVRITREESLEALGIRGLYPCGEGAGYSGGIVSAAVDGIRCAEKIMGAN